jgi:hypothetical protein
MLSGGQDARDAQEPNAVATLSPAKNSTFPTPRSPGDLNGGQKPRDTQHQHAPVDLPPDHAWNGDQRPGVGGSLNGDRCRHATHTSLVAAPEGHGQGCGALPTTPTDPSGALLLVLADSLNDIEGLRKATANQLSALTRPSDVPGGKGLSEYSRAAVLLGDRLAILEQFEHKTVLELRRALRAHPLGPWVKRTVGLGEKQAARLIAAIGDPAWNGAENRPRRGPAELWAYCGYTPGQKRQKGVRSNWNAEAKMRAYLCAESCMKQRKSPYRAVYDEARSNLVDRDTSDGHKHAHALRCVAKAILKDLWLEARAIQDAYSGPRPPAPKISK